MCDISVTVCICADIKLIIHNNFHCIIIVNKIGSKNFIRIKKIDSNKKNNLIATKNNNILNKNHLIVDQTELDHDHIILNKNFLCDF